MAFMSIPRKVRPWKRGLRGLGFDPYTASPAELALHDAQGASATYVAEAGRYAAEDAARAGAPPAQQAAAAEVAKAAALKKVAPDLAKAAQKVVVERQAADADRQRAAQAAEMAKRGVAIKGALPAAPSSTGGSKPGFIATTSTGVQIPKAASASSNTNLFYTTGTTKQVKEDDKDPGFLASVADVLGVLAKPAERIVTSIQERRAADVQRRAERAEQLRLASAPPSERGSSMPSSGTIVTVVGGVVVVGVVLYGLSLLGGPSKAA